MFLSGYRPPCLQAGHCPTTHTSHNKLDLYSSRTVNLNLTVSVFQVYPHNIYFFFIKIWIKEKQSSHIKSKLIQVCLDDIWTLAIEHFACFISFFRWCLQRWPPVEVAPQERDGRSTEPTLNLSRNSDSRHYHVCLTLAYSLPICCFFIDCLMSNEYWRTTQTRRVSTDPLVKWT